MWKNNEKLLNSISIYIYQNEQDDFFMSNIEMLSIQSFLTQECPNSRKKVFFINTGFLLSKILLEENIEWYLRLMELIKKKLITSNIWWLKIIFDYLPLRFFWKSFLKNNYYYLNFENNFWIESFYNVKKKTHQKRVSIQVLVSRLDFLDDLFSSIVNQSIEVKEIFIFVNFKNKEDIVLFELKFLNYMNFSDCNIKLSYSIEEFSESKARIFMPRESECRYILPLDDDDFLDENCVSEVEKVLNNYWDFSLIKGLYTWIRSKDNFENRRKNTEEIGIKEKVDYELDRRKWRFLVPKNIASVDQLYVYNYDLLEYYWITTHKESFNDPWIEIELFLKSEEIWWFFLIEKELYFKRSWESQVTNNFSFQKELFNYLFNILSKTLIYRNIDKYVKIDLFPYIKIDPKH